MLRPFKRIIFTIPTLTSLAGKTTYPLTSLLFCSHHGSVENGWTQLKFGDTPIFHRRLWGGRITSRPKKHITHAPPTTDQQQGSLPYHMLPQGLGFFHRLDHLGYPDNDRRRLAMVVKHEPSICLSPTCKRHPNQPFPFFPGCNFWKAVKENTWFWVFFAAFLLGIHQN